MKHVSISDGSRFHFDCIIFPDHHVCRVKMKETSLQRHLQDADETLESGGRFDFPGVWTAELLDQRVDT